MGQVRVEIGFELDTDIWLSNDCLGKCHRFTRDGRDIELCLPPFDNRDPASIRMGNIGFDGYGGSASGHRDTPTDFQLSICKFRICVREDVEGISQAAFEGDVKKEATALISEHQRECRKLAERIAIDFLDKLRVQGQIWLGVMGSISHSVLPHSTTYDEETGYRFRYGHGGVIAVEARPEEAALTSDIFERTIKALSASKTVPLPESFLADASYFLLVGIRNDTQNDLQRAVLLAAIACELKVKETLQRKVFSDGRALVDALISNPRDFSMSAAGLFDKAMKAAVGHSLNEKENRELYRAIADNAQRNALFQNRNAIAHSGASIKPEVARRNIEAAQKVFAWLEALPVAQR